MCKKSNCYFFRLGECKLGKKHGFLCNMKIARINGIVEVKDYIQIVMTRNSQSFSTKISLVSIVFSFIALVFAAIRVYLSINSSS